MAEGVESGKAALSASGACAGGAAAASAAAVGIAFMTSLSLCMVAVSALLAAAFAYAVTALPSVTSGTFSLAVVFEQLAPLLRQSPLKALAALVNLELAIDGIQYVG